MRTILLFLALQAAFFAAPAFGLPAQKILPPDDPVYDALTFLSMEQGLVIPADSSITVDRAKMILDGIDFESLSPEGKALYDQAARSLETPAAFGFQSGAFRFGFSPVLEPEAFYKTDRESAWIYDYHSRHPFLSLPFSLAFDPYIGAEIVPYAGQNEYAATFHDNFVNLPWDSAQFDIHFPKTGYLSAGTRLGEASGIQFAIGMGNDFFGRTRTGSIVRSDYFERSSYARLSLYSPVIRYGAEITQLGVNKYQYMHYLHIRPVRWFNISFTEGVMANAPLELRFLNPFMIFHGFEAYKTYGSYNSDVGDGGANGMDRVEPTGGSRIGMYFGVKFELQPLKMWRFYGLFAMNQLQLPIEVDKWKDDLTPNAFALQAGTEAAIPALGGYWFFGLEGVYTLPYMYVLHHKDWSFYMETDIERDIRTWVGSPFGPDTIAGTLWLGFKAPVWEGVLSVVFSSQGERSGTDIFDKPHAYYRPNPGDYDVTVPPTGVPIHTLTASLGFSWKAWPWLRLGFQPGYRFTLNPGHESGKTAHSLEFALSLRYSPEKRQKTENL